MNCVKSVLCKALFCVAILASIFPGCGGGTSGTGGRQYRGTATNQNGLPIADLKVTLQETGEATRTNRAGVYELDSRLHASKVNLRFSSDVPNAPKTDRTVEVQDVPLRTRAVIVDVVIDELNNELLKSEIQFEVSTRDGLVVTGQASNNSRFESGVDMEAERRAGIESQEGGGIQDSSNIFTGLVNQLDREGDSEGGDSVEPEPPKPWWFCELGQDNVCGVDNQNYTNACQAAENGVEVAFVGFCYDFSTIDKNGNVSCMQNPPVYAQVCDAQRNVYASRCIAVLESELDPDDMVFCPLPACEVDPVCGVLIDCGNDTKVCGRDGKTYENAKAAEDAWVNIAYHRECIPGALDYYITYSDSGESSHDSICDGLRCRGSYGDMSQIVCGSDGKTYLSECEAIKNGVSDYSQGACELRTTCETDPVCVVPGLCPEDGEVCGKDGNTYPSALAAAEANIGIHYHRACLKYGQSDFIRADECDLSCFGPPLLEDLVCGTDGKDYPSECQAAQVGVAVAFYGRCEETKSCEFDSVCQGDVNCPLNGEVCGKDNVTYSSALEANIAGVGVAYSRSCIDGSFLAVLDRCEVQCYGPPDAGNEVCGKDGKTYINECVAIAHSKVGVAYEGVCKMVDDCSPDSVCSVIDCSLSNEFCGRDNKTYLSIADAAKAGVGIAYSRACLEYSELSPFIDDGCTVRCEQPYDLVGGKFMPAENAKVCGEDGKEYISECFAYLNGVTPLYSGVCEG